jgi:hypothetical protein
MSFWKFWMCKRNPLRMADKPPSIEPTRHGPTKSASEFPRVRLFLLLYFIFILTGSIYLIVYFWTPSVPSVNIQSITTPTGNKANISIPTTPIIAPENKTIINSTNLTVPIKGTANITTVITTSENSSAEVTKTQSFLQLANGTKQILKDDQKFIPKNGTLVFLQLQSTNPEVRLVSVTVLFGLLGASISGITSVLIRKLWDSKYAISLRLIYVYFARPWVGASVALVTYTTLRAGLINVGDATVISEFGIAAISALVGLMADEMTTRLRDIFRSLFGIQSLQEEHELRLSLDKNTIDEGEKILICAILTDLRPTQNVEARFFVQDPDKLKLIKIDKKDKIYFNNSGIAVAAFEGKEKGETVVSVMAGDLNLYDSQEITVQAKQKSKSENSNVETQETKNQ